MNNTVINNDGVVSTHTNFEKAIISGIVLPTQSIWLASAVKQPSLVVLVTTS